MEDVAISSLVQLADITATLHLKYKSLYESIGEEGDVLVVLSRDPEHPNRVAIESRLPNMPIREIVPSPQTGQPVAASPKPFRSTQPSLFDLEHPLSENPEQTETPLDPTAATGNRDMQESVVLEFPRERIVVRRKEDGQESVERLSESQWHILKSAYEAGETVGIDFDDLIHLVPDWTPDLTEYNSVYQMINSLNRRLEDLGITYHVWTSGFVAFIKFGKKPERKRKQGRKR